MLLKALRGSGLKTRLLHPVDEFWDRRMGVHTVGYTPNVGTDDDGRWRAAYVPTRYRRVFATLRHVGVGPDDVVVDLGCGLGRAVFAAAWLGAKRAVGVEIDPGLVAQAERSRQRSRLAGRRIDFVCQSAEDYDIGDMTVLFMFNPFGPTIVQAVIDRLGAELLRRPRRLRIVYENPLHDDVLRAAPFLRCTDAWDNRRDGGQHPVTFWESVVPARPS
jgi:SAM-dependent methyltransferase